MRASGKACHEVPASLSNGEDDAALHHHNLVMLEGGAVQGREPRSGNAAVGYLRRPWNAGNLTAEHTPFRQASHRLLSWGGFASSSESESPELA